MAIQKSKIQDLERIITTEVSVLDEGELRLRPTSLDEYVGQTQIKEHLKVSLKSAKIRNEPLEHVLFYGPPGLGKTTLSQIIAREMGRDLRSSSGPAIEKQADILSLLTSLKEHDILFIDEIHRLKPQIEEILYGAMEDFQIDIMIGSGTGATSVKMDIPKFTLIGATTKLSKLTGPLRDRFGNILKLEFYDINELQTIIKRSFGVFGQKSSALIDEFVAKKSRGTPRIANRYVKILRDYATVGENTETIETVSKIFDNLGIDDVGLDGLDRKLLETLSQHFGGRPVGLGTLASVVGEEESTLEEVVEPYLLKIGYLERTPRGRQITHAGEQYIHNIKNKLK
jgi:Holliday junction DNA helicase RuvB